MLSLFPFSKKGDLASKTTTGIPFIKITISGKIDFPLKFELQIDEQLKSHCYQHYPNL